MLDRNPLKVDPLQIKNIKVVATIKEGREVYRAGGAAARAPPQRTQVEEADSAFHAAEALSNTAPPKGAAAADKLSAAERASLDKLLTSAA